ncbi:RNA-binding protein 26 [Entomortierella parvispora]|uniref:RNA-binding protein 26 n=1 Tax=Entomortierella parvispora TaxID=205924 RepID=A0A9P3LVN7_9FUNG|nr:RNA-binding protein 26 [Entomortierella parvispora]
MHLDDAQHNALKAYLSTELALISDADPGMLADYTIALLRHDKDTAELKALCLSQLADFLQQETERFVDSLFVVLESKSYLTTESARGDAAAVEEESIPTGPAAERHEQRHESSSRGTEKHRRGDSDGSDDEDRSYKHARRDDSRENDRRRDYSPSRPSDDRSYGNDRYNRRSNEHSGSNGNMENDRRGDRFGPSRQGITTSGFNNRQFPESGFNNGSNGSQWNGSRNNFGGNNFQDQQGQSNGSWRGNSNMRGGRGGMHSQGQGFGHDRPRRQRCRDYDEKGFCLRGDACPYDHGEDKIVVDDVQGVPFNMMGGPQGMPPNMMMGMNPNRPPFFPGGANGGGMMGQPGFDSATGALSADGSRSGSEGFGQESGRFQESGRGGMRGGRGSLRGVRGGRGRGGSSHPYSGGRFGSASASKTSLVVEHIPDEFNTIDKVNDFFKQFGSLTNIQVDQPAHKALLQYSTNEEAKAAYNSPEVIFGNRFVKVYWQPDDVNADTFGVPQPKPAGQVRPETSSAGAPRHQPFSQQPPTTSVLMTPERAAELAAERAAAAAKLAENKKTMMEIQRQKDALIQRQQEEQKLLLQKMFANKNMSQEDKDEILKGLKNVAIEVTKEPVNQLAQAQAAIAAAEAQKQLEHQKEIERLEKVRLDRELENLNGVPEQDSTGAAPAAAPASEAAQTTAALKAKLAALQAQAAAMGLESHGGYAGRGRGGYVPRGRGRGAPGNIWTRGGAHGARGGATTSYNRTFRIDNRSTKLSVQNVDETSKNGLKEHFESFGELESFSLGADGASATVQYKNRKDAELAMQQGSQVANAPAPLKLGWISDPAPTTSNAPATSSYNASAGFKAAPTISSPAVAAISDPVDTAYHEESDDEDGERSWKR